MKRPSFHGFFLSILEQKGAEALARNRAFKRLVHHVESKGVVEGAKAVSEELSTSEPVSRFRRFKRLFFDEVKADLGYKNEQEKANVKLIESSVRKRS